MNFNQCLRAVREHLLTVTICVVLAALGSGLVAYSRTAKYAASGKLFVSAQGATDASQLNQGGLFTQQRVKSYADLMSGPNVAQAVISRLGLTMPIKDLQSEITASAPLDTVLISYTVTDPSPTRARDLAATLGTEFAVYVERLETPRGQSASPVKVTVTDSPTLPTAPVSPKKTLDLSLGLLLGLLIGIGGAILLEGLDNTVGAKHDPTEITGAPILGTIKEEPAARPEPLIVDADKFSARAEAYRQLRTNIRFLGIDRDVRSMVITSAVSTEGKTSIAANLAIALAQAGDRVVLVDTDLRRPRVAEMFGLPEAKGLTSVLLNDVVLEAALQIWRPDLPLGVLPSGPIPPNPSELLSSKRMAEIAAQLADKYDFVIFDSPPLLPVTDAAILARVTKGAILVTRVGDTRAQQLSAAARILQSVGADLLGVVLSRVPRRGEGKSNGRYTNWEEDGDGFDATVAPPLPPQSPRYRRPSTVPLPWSTPPRA